MEFRKALKKDIDNIMRIIKQAQNYFKENGVDQWQNNYPNSETISNDIENGISYVLLKGNKIIATVALSFDGESTYNSIYDGEWISNDKYAVIHRIAVDNKYKRMGISTEIIKNIEKLCLSKDFNSIKVDTHEDNISMQNLLKKNDFKYCGVIYLEDKSKRIAFEKLL
ncbi:GNAT family N-acetyltransferase [Clostridium carnis]